MKGIQQRRTYYGSLDDTVITIEADENTPLLVDVLIWPDNNNNNNNHQNENNKINIHNNKSKYGKSSWSFESSNQSNDSNYSTVSTKSFKSHFAELKVLAFALILTAAISIAIYLLVIESRLPSITLYLDLVSHDIWSGKIIPNDNHLQHNSVDHIILMQTGNRNCDIHGECLKVLREMQNNEQEELPYNFLIGGNGQAFEVRGWKYQSSMKGIPQEQALVIGVIGNFDQTSPQKIILATIQSLIRESCKRLRMINRRFYIYGLRRNDHDRKEGQKLFTEIMEWPEFKGFITNNQKFI